MGRLRRSLRGKSWGCRRCGWGRMGALLIATSPDGKVYWVPGRRHCDGSGAAVLFDPALTEEKPKYIWDVAVIGGSAV